MEEKKKIVNKITDWLNGKKTVIGISLHVAWFLSNIIFKDLATQNEAMVGHGIILNITGVGIGHKAVKNKEKITTFVNSMISKLKK